MSTATFNVHWASSTASSSNVRHPRWISPSAKSIAVEVNGDPSLTTVADKPAQGSVSTVTVKAPAGTDAITISVWDAPGGTGNELGQANVVATIVAGQTNAISATLDGVVAKIDFAPLPNQPTLRYLTTTLDATGSPSYSIVGDFSVTFAATPKDADGNVIVAASVTASSTSSSLAVTPVSGQTNQFAVQTVGPPTHTSGILVKSSDPSGIVQSNYPFHIVPFMIVAYKNGGAGVVSAINSDDGTVVSLAGTFPGTTSPVGLAQDTDNHRILVLDGASGSVLAYHSDGTPVTGFPNVNVPNAVSLAYDSNAHRIYVVASTGQVKAFGADGTPVQLSGAFQDLVNPSAIAYSPSVNTLVVADPGSGTFNVYDENGNLYYFDGDSLLPEFSMHGFVPVAAATDDQANLYLSGQQSVIGGTRGGPPSLVDGVAEFSLRGGSVASQSSGITGPSGLFYNAAEGTVYVANSTGEITVFDALLQGVVRTIPAASNLSAPTALLMVY